MKILLERLTEILKEEIRLHTELLSLSRDKECIIINNQVNLLKEMVSREEEIISLIQKEEEARYELMKALALYFKISVKKLTMYKLLELIDVDFSAELKNIHQEILALIKKLKSVNERNGALIKTSLDLVSYSMNLYVSLASQEPVYSAKGRLAKKVKTNFILDEKI